MPTIAAAFTASRGSRIGSAALTGAADYQVNYTNANGINGEWQNPKRGDQMIQGLLKISDVKTGEYLLAESVIPEQFGWTWIFALEGDGEGRTRLINRTRIAAPGKPNQAMITVLGLGGSIMNRRMMNGLVAHPEGWVEPAYQEWLEAGLWLAALFIGLAAATLFLARRRWAPSLLVACAAVVAILILTFVQPAIWVPASNGPCAGRRAGLGVCGYRSWYIHEGSGCRESSDRHSSTPANQMRPK